MEKRFICVFAVFLLLVVTGCSVVANTEVEVPTLVTVSFTTAPNVTLSPTMEEPTPTKEPTYTDTPEPTLTPTVTLTPTATRSSIEWSSAEFGKYYAFVGSWFVGEYSYPELPRENDSIAQFLVQIEHNEESNEWFVPVEMVDPAAVCQWTFDKLSEGYSLVIVIDGNQLESKTREERWSQFSSALGDSSKEPYCPQFDRALEVPVFDNTD